MASRVSSAGFYSTVFRRALHSEMLTLRKTAVVRYFWRESPHSDDVIEPMEMTTNTTRCHKPLLTRQEATSAMRYTSQASAEFD